MKKIIWIVLGLGLVMMVGKSNANTSINKVFAIGRADPAIQSVIDTQLQGATEGDARFVGDLYYINRDRGAEAAKAASFTAAKIWAKPKTADADNYALYNYPNITKWFNIKNGKPQDPTKDKPVDIKAFLGLINSATSPAGAATALLGVLGGRQ